MEIPTGTIADYVGRKHSLILAALVVSLGALVYASVPNFYVFLLAEFLFATATALFSGAGEAFAYDTLKKIGRTRESKKIFAKIGSLGLAGIMIGAPIGNIMAHYLGLNAPMFFMVVPCMIALVIGLTFKEPKTSHKIESKRYLNILKSGIKSFYKNKILRILAFDMISISAIAYFMIWLYQPLLQRADLDIKYFGIVHALFVLTQIIVMNNYERLEKLFGSKKRLIFAGAFSTGLFFIIGGLTSYLPLVLVVIIIGGGIGMSREPLFASYMNKHIKSSNRATVLSSITMIRKFILIIVNPAVGFMVDWSLGYTLIILGTLAIVFSFVSRVEEDYLID